MARQADQVVADIRATRARLGGRVASLTSLDRVMGDLRARPVAWIGGGLLAGLLVGRVWGGSLLSLGRRRIESKVRSQVQSGLGAALLAAWGPRFASRRGPGAGESGTPAVPDRPSA